MWPATEHFGSHFAARAEAIHGEASVGDHLQAVYHLWLVGHQLEHGRAPWLDPYTFRPESSPRVNFGGWPFGLPFWPLEAAFGSVVAWNVLLLLTYLAAGGFTFLWLRELGLPHSAALVGGLAFELAPYRVAQSAGHLRGMIAVLLPLAMGGIAATGLLCLVLSWNEAFWSLNLTSAKAGTLRAEGTYDWGGAAGTWFWIDPVNDLAFVGLIQNQGGNRCRRARPAGKFS